MGWRYLRAKMSRPGFLNVEDNLAIDILSFITRIVLYRIKTVVEIIIFVK